MLFQWLLAGATLALSVASCSNTTVEVNGAGGSDAGAATPQTICTRLSALPCATPVDTCVSDVEAGLATCTGSAAAQQALLDCLNGAQYDCSGGKPTTSDCSSAFAAASCSSTPGGGSDAGQTVDAPATDGSATGICGGLCANGVQATYSCTSPSHSAFTVQFGTNTSNCAPGRPQICHGSSTSVDTSLDQELAGVEFDCDGTIQSYNSPCTQAGSWSLQGNQLQIDLTNLVASCTRQ